MTDLICRILRTEGRWKRLLFSAIFVICVSSIAQAEGTIGHNDCCGRQDVILIRGGLGFWPGANALADEFRCLGYAPTVIYGWEAGATARKIACAHQRCKMAGGVIIVGYSSGADAACVLAQRLETYGIGVQTMVLIESTLGTPVPGNVDYCINYYASRKLDMIPMFRGIPVEAESPCTIIHNIDVKEFPEFASQLKRNHFAIGSTTAMREMATGAVVSRQPAMVSSHDNTLIGTLPPLPVRR
ncbi:MAG: hypothetical protein WCH39_24040 [Schlesneria sp.]